jgi:alanine dehydrogenase
MPGAVPRTSTYALTNATLPYSIKLADLGPARAIRESAALAGAANVIAGHLTCQPVAEAFDLPWRPALEAAGDIG